MTTRFNVTPRTRLIDKDGFPTRDMFGLLNYLQRIADDVGELFVDDAIANGVTGRAPSQNVVFDALAAKANTADLVSTLIADAVTDGVTDKAPTSNAVFDALGSYLTTAAAAAYLKHDGSGAMTGPLQLASYTVAGVPDPAACAGAIIFVSDESGGPTPAFSDGADWLRLLDFATIS